MIQGVGSEFIPNTAKNQNKYLKRSAARWGGLIKGKMEAEECI
jgi:hypothetical protein